MEQTLTERLQAVTPPFNVTVETRTTPEGAIITSRVVLQETGWSGPIRQWYTGAPLSNGRSVVICATDAATARTIENAYRARKGERVL